VPFDLTGSPTITLPGRLARSRMPIGVQLVAGHQQESDLITAAAGFQRETRFRRRHPIP
jgi:amidase